MQIAITIFIIILGLLAYYKGPFSPIKVLLSMSLVLIAVFSLSASLTVLFLTYLTSLLQRSKTKSWVGIIVHLVLMISVNYFSDISIYLKLGLSYYGLQNIGILLISIRKQPQNYTFFQLLFANVFFAKFVSGPILLPKEISNLGVNNNFHPENIYSGLNRILFGLLKKLVLADNLSLITNTVFHHPEASFKAPTIAIASIAFTLEMYLNFSAYTDIAIGIGKMFNIQLKENFKRPMRSNSISAYWRKTHISLIDWLTQNLFYYITYTFRKNPVTSSLLGIFITFTLSGIWHGAAIGFLIWGILNAVYLMIEFLLKRKGIIKEGRLKLLGWLITFFSVSFSNLFFRAGYIANIKAYCSSLFSSEGWDFNFSEHIVAILGNGGYLEQQFKLLSTLGLVLIFFGFEKRWERISRNNKINLTYWVGCLLIMMLCSHFDSGSEFIYMQF